RRRPDDAGMSDPAAPSWVRTADGRLEPFDAGRIARSLFAAGPAVGVRDAFLCRELADAAVHFLATDADGTPSAADVAEVVARTVRELGQPALARAYEERRPEAAASGVYSPDVMAADAAGIIELCDRDAPELLTAVVAGHPDADGLAAALAIAPRVALDGIEYLDGVTRLNEALRGSAAFVYPNLNVPPPPWTDAPAGPLFAEAEASDRQAMRRRGAERLPAISRPREWHVSDLDLTDGLIEQAADFALRAEGATAFVFDRPRRPVALGGGLTRQHPAVLTRVGLNLVALAEQPGMLADADRYCQRLGSLAGLAVSAAVQKRDHLRRQNRRPITDGFLLDRARFVAVAQGLDEVVKRFTGWSVANGGPSLALGRRIAQRLNDVLRQDGRAMQLETFLDGLTPDAPGASVRSQTQAAGALHAVAEGGTLRLHLPREAVHTGATLAEELRRAWRETAVGRVELVRAGERQA
ncbi:MAG: ATP cone domain-containing protein, partial [Gemmataceae bacterium]